MPKRATPLKAHKAATQAEAKVKKTCGAKTRSGLPCQNTNLYPNGRCHFHGGPTPSGMAHHSKRGKEVAVTEIVGVRPRTRYIPPRLAEAYERAMDDPDLLSQRSGIAIAEARLEELLQRVDTGESDRAWVMLSETWASAQKEADPDERKRLLASVARLITQGAKESAIWSEIFETTTHIARLKAAERRHLLENQTMVSTEDAIHLMAAYSNAVKRAIENPDIPRERLMMVIGTDLAHIMGRRV